MTEVGSDAPSPADPGVPVEPGAVILGGGLAGIAAAWELARIQGSDAGIVLIEAADRLGGKARSLGEVMGANGWTVTATDKGYHIFPRWYWDLWAFLSDIGVEVPLDHRRCTRDRCQHATKPAGSQGDTRFTCPKSPASRDYTLVKIHPDRTIEAVEASISLGKIPAVASLLAVMLGLTAADTRNLDRRTLEDHLQHRWYASNATLERVREIVLKALANPSVDASALTTANTFHRWLPVFTAANWRALRGPLQSELILPMKQALEAQGVTIVTDTTVEWVVLESAQASSAGYGRVVRIELSDDQELDTGDAVVVSTLPANVLPGVVTWDDGTEPVPQPGSRARGTPETLRALLNLEAAPMASLDLYLDCLPEVGGESFPEGHFSLVGSRYAITGFAASKVWRQEHRDEFPGHAEHLLQFVCSDVGSLVGAIPGNARRLLRAEIGRFIPELTSPEDRVPEADALADPVVEAVLLMNDAPAEQVTRNEAGTLEYRPTADVGALNLTLAGDFCRTPVDVASMEAAVSSGILAAREALRDRRRSGPRGERFGLVGRRPLVGWPRRLSYRMPRAVVSVFGLLGIGLSYVVGLVLAVIGLPYRISLRLALQGLEADPRRRRARDRLMTFAGPLVLVVGPTCGVIAWANTPEFDPSENPYSDLAAHGAPSAAVLLWGCVAIYVLLMVFTVPVRRFLPWSRQTGAGLLVAAAGYLLFVMPFARVAEDGSVPWPHWVAALAILVGPNWSVVAAARALRHAAPQFKWLRISALIRRWVSVIVLLVALGMTIAGSLTFWVQVAALLAGHLWILALTVYLLRTSRPAETVLLPGPQPVSGAAGERPPAAT